jgi:xylulokinase
MTSTRRLILAVDCGSTNFKAALFSGALARLGEGSVPVPYTVQGGAVVELSGEDVWAAFLDLVGKTCASAGISPRALDAVAFDSQAQTFALYAPSGQALTPFFSWMDSRAEAEAAELTVRLGRDFHCHCSFAPPIPQLQVAKMLWMARHLPEAVRASSRLVSLPGFLAERLGVPNTTDRNLAAMGGAYSLARGDWWPEALALCGMTAERMPRLVDVGTTVGASTSPYGDRFRPDLEVTFAGNDQTAGAYGNACERGGMVVTLGTALVVYRHTGTKPGPYNPGGCWGPYPGGSYYELGTIDQGCQALDWARNQLLPGTPPAAFDAAAHSVVEAHREALAPLFQPGRIGAGKPWSEAPVDVPTAAYAVLEGISFALRRLIEVNLGAAGQVQQIAVSGGGGKSAVWLALLASALGSPVSRSVGDALLGAAALSAGVPPTAELAGRTVYRPDPDRSGVLQPRYRRWAALP